MCDYCDNSWVETFSLEGKPIVKKPNECLQIDTMWKTWGKICIIVQDN